MKTEVLIKEKDEGNHPRKYNSFLFWGVLIITAVIFSGSLKLAWTNWDDDLYVYKNPVVSEGTLKDIFTTSGDYNMYVPLVIASFALEWKMVKDRPFLYHLDNVLLHLFCTALVLLFFRRMGLSVWWSGFAALLFGIHPLRVETVAWITERKELLCALFYLAALLAYLRYIASGKRGHLLFTILFIMLSLFSKAEALTLPFALVLLDWYFQRKIDPKVIIEKVIFFALVLFLILPQYFFFGKMNPATTDSNSIVNAFNFIEQAVLGCYVYAVYILKSIVPYATSTIYPIPASLSSEHWIGAAMAIVVFVSALAVWRKHRFVIFGLLFFTFNICFLILVSFYLSDFAFLNDRYAYIAYIGLFFVIAMGMQQLSDKFPLSRLPVVLMAVALLVASGILTIKYIPVWKNSETLWTHVIEKYPRQIPVAYLNRAHYWYKNNRREKAIEDLNAAIEINPDYLLAHLNRGLIYLENNDNEKALQDYNRYLALASPSDINGNILDPSVSDALGNKGLIYTRTGQYKKALLELDLAIKFNPSNPINYINRAIAYQKQGRIAEARQDLQTAEKLGAEIDPSLKKLLTPR